MKFYVHYEEPPETTIVIMWPDDKEGCIKDVIQIFIDSVCEGLKVKLKKGITNINLLNSKRVQVPQDADPRKVIRNKDDLYVVWTTGPDQSVATQRVEKDLPKLSISSSKTTDRKVKDLLQDATEYRAMNLLHLAVSVYKEVLLIHEKNKDALHGLASIYLKANRPHEALKIAQKGENFYPDDVHFKIEKMEAMLQCQESPVEYILETCKDRRQGKGLEGEDKWKVQCLLARGYQLQGMRDMAIVVFQGVLRENPNHLEATIHLAALVHDLNETFFRESISSLLAALPKLPGDKGIQQNLVKICKKPGGMERLQSCLQSAWGDMSAVFYVSCIFRDWGGTDQAIELMKRCIELEPQNPQVALTMAHMLEGKCLYFEAVQMLRTFLTEKSDYTTIGSLSVDKVIELLQDIENDIYMWNPPQTSPEENSPTLQAQVYSDEERYTIAVLFTIVKILFINGAISVLTSLVRLLVPFQSESEWHKTDIRNEAAYFNCVYKILDTPPVIPDKSRKFIYHLGDSHCLTSAWKCITHKGTEHMIHPILSTGTKIWHLRPEGVFYTKENFYAAVQRIPDGAAVIINFGEIDCREALLQCVDKCRYDNLDDAVKCVIDIYMALLDQLHRDHKWNIFIHPVPPVLAITRPVVDDFNRCLKARLKGHQFLHYLDVLDSLLTEDKSALREKYEFDGTHLHPSYTSLLESAMNSVTS